MRKYSLTLLIVLLAMALGLSAVACGSGDKTASGLTPEEAVKAAIEDVQTANSQSGTYEIAVTINADSADSDPMMQAFLGQPIAITGDFATQMDPVRADMTMGMNLMGMAIEFGVRAVDDQAWLNMMGQWYVLPTDELEQQGMVDAATLSADMMQMLTDMGIDPNTWYTDLTVVGKETLVDVETTHMSGSVDIQKMFTDVFALMQDPEFMTLLGDVAESDSALTIPDTSEMQEVQDMVDQMFSNATFDLWLANEDNSLRKMVESMDITIPQDMGMTGVSGANIMVTVNLDAPGAAVEVSAPASAKSIEELAEDLENNPLLSGLGGLLGGGDVLGL